jgi:hypothetical protein
MLEFFPVFKCFIEMDFIPLFNPCSIGNKSIIPLANELKVLYYSNG